jgi:hypothetical protein
MTTAEVDASISPGRGYPGSGTAGGVRGIWRCEYTIYYFVVAKHTSRYSFLPNPTRVDMVSSQWLCLLGHLRAHNQSRHACIGNSTYGCDSDGRVWTSRGCQGTFRCIGNKEVVHYQCATEETDCNGYAEKAPAPELPPRSRGGGSGRGVIALVLRGESFRWGCDAERGISTQHAAFASHISLLVEPLELRGFDVHVYLVTRPACALPAQLSPLDVLINAAGSTRVRGAQLVTRQGQAAGMAEAVALLANNVSGAYTSVVFSRCDLTLTAHLDEWGCDPADASSLGLAGPCRDFANCTSDVFYVVPAAFYSAFADAVGRGKRHNDRYGVNDCCFHPTCIYQGGHSCTATLAQRAMLPTPLPLRFCFRPMKKVPNPYFFLARCGYSHGTMPNWHDPCVHISQIMQRPYSAKDGPTGNLVFASAGSLGLWPGIRHPYVYCPRRLQGHPQRQVPQKEPAVDEMVQQLVNETGLQQVHSPAAAESAAPHHTALSWPNSVGSNGIYAQLKLVELLPNGTLPLPSKTTHILLEVGANTRNTVDYEKLGQKQHANAFLLTFEPILDKYASLLARNSRPDSKALLGHHHRRGVVLPFAVSSQDGFAPLHMHGTFDGCASLLQRGEIRFRRECIDPNPNSSRALDTRLVPTVTLHRVLSEWLAWEGGGGWPIEYLKIDAQGMDIGVFESAKELKRRVRMVEMEVVNDKCKPMYAGALNCSETVRRMAEYGYSVVPPTRTCTSARFTEVWGCEVNFLFERAD